MKKIKLASAILFSMMIFVCEKSLAQSQENTGQQTTNQTDPNVSTQETPAPDASQSTDPNSTTEANKVTIDSTAATGTSTDYGTTSGSTKSESTTKIHIYSGKHDGNNTINPDPKN